MADVTRIITLVVNGKDAATPALKGVSNLLGGLGKVAAVGVAGLAAAGAGAAVAIGKLAMDAAPLQDISAAFEGIATASGKSAAEMMAALKKGSAGMVTGEDLMMSYNQAAGLVSTTFANQLPDAMGYLTKVAASTGQDMGFMLDSLVKGVGRLSPMILDNLQIQVSLADATERASQMFGVAAEELSKEQIQAGMMAVTMEKLKANTAAMPDVTKSAATQMAAFKATMQDTKSAIGLAFVPILQTLLGLFNDLWAKHGPAVTGVIERMADVVATIAEAFGTFFSSVIAGEDPLVALKDLLAKLVPPEVLETVMGIAGGIRGFIAAAQEVLAPVVAWIGQNVKLQDVLIALGIVIASVVLPALWGVIVAAAPIVAAIVGLIAVAMLLRKMWESDFLGIRTALEGTWAKILPVLKVLWDWLKVNIPKAIETLVSFWETTLLPAIKAVWAFVETNFIPILAALGNVVGAVLVVAGRALAGLWQNVLLPALKAAGAWIKDTFGPILDKFVGWLNKITGGLEGVKKALSAVRDWIQRVADKITSIHLPSWLTPGSPTPFEIGLVGIADVVRRLAQVELPKMALALSPAMTLAPMGFAGGLTPGAFGGAAMQPAFAGTGNTYINVTVEGDVLDDRSVDRIADAIAQRQRLRGVRRY